MEKLLRTLDQLKRGETARIVKLAENTISLKLMEMGCVPGARIKVYNRVPFRGPICIQVCGYNLAMRREEASAIVVE